jgi:Protein of unknown function (DUF2796)
MRFLVVTVLAATLPPAMAAADDTRQLDAHVHGESKLSIALEAGNVSMVLEAPAADIVGFEYEPSTDEQKAAVENAKAVLANPLDLFVLPDKAGCTVTSVSVEHLFEEHEHEDDAHHEEDGHDADHDAEHNEDHEDHEEGTHSEFRASYELACSDPVRLNTIDFAFFDRFPNAQVIDVQAIGETGQSGFEVERGSPTISLSGVTG